MTEDKYIWIFDKPERNKFDDYADNIDAHIDVGSGCPWNTIIPNPKGFNYNAFTKIKKDMENELEFWESIG